jgi:hypothetical protein
MMCLRRRRIRKESKEGSTEGNIPLIFCGDFGWVFTAFCKLAKFGKFSSASIIA